MFDNSLMNISISASVEYSVMLFG